MPQKRHNKKSSPTPSKEKSPIPLGTKVALLNHPERGTLSSYSNGIFTIDLDEGISIPARLEEFVMIDRSTYAKSTNVDLSTKEPQSSKAFSKELTIDLHISSLIKGVKIEKGQCLGFQLEVFRSILDENFVLDCSHE